MRTCACACACAHMRTYMRVWAFICTGEVYRFAHSPVGSRAPRAVGVRALPGGAAAPHELLRTRSLLCVQPFPSRLQLVPPIRTKCFLDVGRKSSLSRARFVGKSSAFAGGRSINSLMSNLSPARLPARGDSRSPHKKALQRLSATRGKPHTRPPRVWRPKQFTLRSFERTKNKMRPWSGRHLLGAALRSADGQAVRYFDELLHALALGKLGRNVCPRPAPAPLPRTPHAHSGMRRTSCVSAACPRTFDQASCVSSLPPPTPQTCVVCSWKPA